MDVDGCVLAAGRAILDLVERDWQPLSTVELDQRLDQAVEDVLEADLIHKVKRTSESPSRNDVATASSSTPEEVSEEVREDNEAVKYVTARLRDFQSRNRLTGRARLSLSQTVPLCLTLLSSRVSYRTLSRLYRLEKGNIHRIFFFFCKCVNTLRDEHIRWPRGDAAEAALFPLSGVLEHDERAVEGRHIPRVLGVLGHTRIPIRIPSSKDSAEPEVKRTKKTEERNVSWLHLELVCDRMGRFIHCRIGNTRDADRGGALGSQLKRESHPMPPDSVLVARAGYPLTACILTPYPGRGGTREERFNATLEPHFHILDRAVACLTGRFRRLRRLDVGNCSRARAVALSACILHNMLMDVGHVPHGEVEEAEDCSQDGEGQEDEAGVHLRDFITEILHSGNL
ncbi:LOW QUALITY PROTEIN: uncharacterized protein LOC127589139 [Hippocampus zosterae]|uniref:LOW QUALITY PROTEIN: uncharacterized protein LOC127589139 n=1 Tax=Hippocampus zosterae TaxID=109293 RepID=UPI00223CC280|nr:LOW QUALITY PROTEIN: uncharacterized protein LOC127589139 [Hippocampus zosterae]